MKVKVILCIMFFATASCLKAQVYLQEKTQHRFAQTYVGINTLIVPSTGSFVYDNTSVTFPNTIIPRLTIGGLHFWGKWDFTVNLILTRLGNEEISSGAKLSYRPGGNFGAKYYPWRMEFGKLRPYVGAMVAQQILSFEENTRGERIDFFFGVNPVVGCSYAVGGWQLNFEANLMPFNKRKFYTTRDQISTMHLPPVQLSIGIRKYFDATLSNEKYLRTDRFKKTFERLESESKLNAFYIGVGPSSSYFIGSSTFEDDKRQSLPRHKANFNLDFGAGYFFNDQRLHVGLSYREYQSNTVSYQLEHVVRRKSLALEVFKYYLNLGGFNPFIGPSISLENWASGEFTDDVQIGETFNTRMISPGIIFGWDILPSPLEKWVLRTNMRYYPFQRINDVNGRKSKVDQFEFNFIQFVLYPSRLFQVPKMS